jgi:hypothetical protein
MEFSGNGLDFTLAGYLPCFFPLRALRLRGKCSFAQNLRRTPLAIEVLTNP